MIIHSTIRDYEVIYAESADFFGNLPSVNSFYVIDRKVYELYVSYFAPLDKDRLFLIDATEYCSCLNRWRYNSGHHRFCGECLV